ncbi:Bacteriophage P2-related tail formation protein [Serratia liquefaciens]|nr:Bacteriophage P2-related tail formation protein [Serratia liquefaciens]
MSSVLPPGSSALERRAAEACSVGMDLNVPLRDLWNPARCPVKFLPYLAWAFSVDRWDEDWPEAEKRKAVSDAFYIHRRKGTVAAIRRVIENMGYAMSIAEWWEVADPAGTFRLTIDVNDIGITEEMVSELERLIGEAKSASRHIAQLSISTQTSGNIYAAASAFDGDIVTIYPSGYEPKVEIKYNSLPDFGGNYRYSGESYDENY